MFVNVNDLLMWSHLSDTCIIIIINKHINKQNRDKMLERVNQAFEIYDIGDALPVFIH
jgi:hypothetical protein